MDSNVTACRGYSAVHNIGRNIIIDHVVSYGSADRYGHTRTAESTCYCGCSAVGHNAGGIISGQDNTITGNIAGATDKCLYISGKQIYGNHSGTTHPNANTTGGNGHRT